jgi:hypothetical protein
MNRVRTLENKIEWWKVVVALAISLLFNGIWLINYLVTK